MPPLRTDGFAETGPTLRLRKIRPDDRRALQARNVRHLRVDLDFAVVLAELQLLLRAQVLATEEDDTPLGDQQGELISLLVRQIFELQADDLSADMRCEVPDFFRGGEEGFLLFVCAGAGVGVFSVLVSDGVDILEEERDGRAILRCWSVLESA